MWSLTRRRERAGLSTGYGKRARSEGPVVALAPRGAVRDSYKLEECVMFRRKRKPRASTKDCEAPIDLVKECVDYGRMEAIRILEQNPGIDRDELTRQVIAKTMKRYQAVAPS